MTDEHVEEGMPWDYDGLGHSRTQHTPTDAQKVADCLSCRGKGVEPAGIGRDGVEQGEWVCPDCKGTGEAALQSHAVPQEVVDELKRKYEDADFHCRYGIAGSTTEAYHQGERNAYEEALALLGGKTE